MLLLIFYEAQQIFHAIYMFPATLYCAYIKINDLKAEFVVQIHKFSKDMVFSQSLTAMFSHSGQLCSL